MTTTKDADLQAALDYRATLTRNTLVLTTESEPRFNALLDSYIRKFQPRDVVEMDLVIDMVACRWRQRRAQGLETALLDIELFEQRDTIRKEWTSIDNTSRAALAWKALTDDTGALNALTRYEARLRRQYHRTLQMLLDLRAGYEKENLPNEPEPTPAHPDPAPKQPESGAVTAQPEPKQPQPKQPEPKQPAPKPTKVQSIADRPAKPVNPTRPVRPGRDRASEKRPKAA